MMKRALLLMTLLVCLVLRAEATATTLLEGDTTLTITVTEAGDVATFAAGISTSDYPNVTRVNIVGDGVTPSADDLAAIEKFTAISILDLSKVKIEDATAYKNIKTPNYNSRKISLVVAAAKDENDSTVVDDQVEYLRNIFKTAFPNAWESNFNAIYVYNTNTNGNHTCHAFMTTYDNSGLKDIDVLADRQDNLNIISLDEAWDTKNNLGKGNSYDILVALNNVNVKRLILANVFGGWEGGTLETFTNPHVKALTLPTGDTDLTKEEGYLKNIKLGDGAAAKAFIQLVCAAGTDNPYYLYGYSAEAGALATFSNDHYYQSDINEAYKEVYYGNINLEDFDFFKGIKNNRLDLSNLTHVDADGNEIDINKALATYKNEYIEYLVLPDNDDYPTDPTFNNYFEGENACKNLKAVGIRISEQLPTDSIRNSIVISSNERGGIYSIAELMGNNRLQTAHRYQLSGLAYAKDLAAGGINVDEKGHLTVSKKDDNGAITKGTTGTDVTGILNFTNATDFDYSHLRLWNKDENISDEEKKAAQNDLCLSLMGYGKTLTSIKLPTDESVYRLPSSFCPAGVTKLQSICIPANYTEIGSSAFTNINCLELVYTTAEKDGKSGYLVGGKFQEQEPDITDKNTEHTVQLPTNLKRIEKNAFANVEKFTDVYVTTNNAGEVPYCEKDAFSSGTLQGWGGFNGTHPITRKNYQNANDKLFGILHFPSGLPMAKAELFTDLQRNYSLVDEAGTTDGNGNVFIWPTQEEWYRSFNQANTGYTWNNWTVLDENGGLYGGVGEKYNKREDLADKDGNLTKNAINYGLTAISGDGAIYNNFAPKNPNYTEGSTESILEQNDTWIGWHQFVLVGAYDYVNPDDKKWHFTTSDNNWWTICLPFNMTAQQIEETWGKGTKLCTLTGVTRDYTNNLICLEFGKDLVQEAKDSANTGNVLKWRMPYMIKPARKTYTSENGEAYTGPTFTLSDEQYETLKEATKKITEEVGKHPRPQTTDDACCITVQAKDENGHLLNTTADKPYMYTFLGSYTKQYIPTYAYFLAWCADPTNTNGWVNYFYQTEKPTIKNWNAYTSIVGHFNVEEATWTIPDKEAGKWAFSCSGDKEQRDAHEDALPNPSGDTKVKLAFDEGNATAIGHMTANGSIQSVENATVYNLNGQVVAHNGNVEGLPKGVYIIAGKKFIVK